MGYQKLYGMSSEEFYKLTGKERYKMYLSTDEWRNISKFLREHEGSCRKCGGKENLIVHHLSYKNLKYSKVGSEYMYDIVVICRDCHMSAHKDDEVFKVIENEDSIKLHEFVRGKQNPCSRRGSKRQKLFVVYRSNFRFDSKDGRSGFPIKRIFASRKSAEKYISDYRKIPWHYLVIKEMDLW